MGWRPSGVRAYVPVRTSIYLSVSSRRCGKKGVSILAFTLTKALSVSAVQGFSAEDSCGYQPVWPRHGHRACEHRFQL